MNKATFSGGIHPDYYKDISLREPLRGGPDADVYIIPLSQHIGAPNTAIVNKGDFVEEGQIIGESKSFVSSPVHSPVTGKVKDIKKAIHPALGPIEAIFIEKDKEAVNKEYKENDVENITALEIIEKVKKAGIIGMGGASFPTHVKLSIPEGKKIQTLIINGAECEPYLTCDHLLMTKKTEEIIKGLELVIKVINPEKTYIAIEDNKKAAIFSFTKALKKNLHKALDNVSVVTLHTKYPQGGEKQLIKAVAGKEVPPGKLPLDIGFLVQNVGTLNAIYEAVYFDRPLTERIVTISGDCMNRPGNFLFKVGTTVKDIIEQCPVMFTKEPKKIIFGGPMMGFSQVTKETPILKNTSGVLFFSSEKAEVFEEKNCIKCAKCVDTCPVKLVPTEIMKNVKKAKWAEVEKLCINDCMECGSCAYICPARIPIVQYIKEGKIKSRR